MDFVKKDWQFRDIISENELNRMEDGIEEGITKAEQAQQTATDAQTNLDNHVSATTGVHGATSTATPNTIVQRDPDGRFKAAAPSAADDVARKDTVDNAIAALRGAAPGTLDTLAKLAQAINNDPNFAATINAALAGKFPKDGSQPFTGQMLHVVKDADGQLTSVLIENLDQRLNLGAYYEAGVAQYALLQSLNDAGGEVELKLNPASGNVTSGGHKIWTAGNDGAGSGLDADLLDGLDSSAFSLKSDYVRQPGYAVATGSANAYAVTLNPAPTAYTEGMAVAVKINVDNTGASTINVNGLGAKPIKKPNGNDVAAGNLKAGSIYTLRYNATTGNFILQGEGGSGDAQPADVLSGKTFTNDQGEQTGTMPNRGNVTQTLTNQGQEYTIPAGYHAGGGKVTANITNLTAANIKAGVSVGGVAGTFTSDATATAGQILSGQTAYVNGSKVTGTMANRTGHVTGQSVSRSGTTLRIRPQTGYYPGDSENSVQFSDANFVASNIRNGVSIFGLTGTLEVGKKAATGSISSGNTQLAVTGLDFTPRIILVRAINDTSFSNIGYYLDKTYPGGSTITANNFYWSSSNIGTPFSVSTGGFTTTLPHSGFAYFWFASE